MVEGLNASRALSWPERLQPASSQSFSKHISKAASTYENRMICIKAVFWNCALQGRRIRSLSRQDENKHSLSGMEESL